MRTTLTIDDDVLLAVKERARRENRTAGEVLSELVRQALTRTTSSGRERKERGFHGFHPLPHRGKPISNSVIDQLREEEPE